MDQTKHDVGGPAQPLLLVQDLRKHFVVKGRNAGFKKSPPVRAVDGISFSVAKGETLGVVGESGCGKSTMARLLIRLIEPDTGDVIIDGQKVGSDDGISVRAMRSIVQMVFQDSYASLNPRLPIEESVAFGAISDGVPRKEAMARAISLLEKVGLDPRMFVHRYPHELSGGQRQRVNIARALALQPRLLILDEAVSALDKSVEAQVLNLLQELKQKLELTYIFISHDLNVIQYISDRVLVMYLGKAVEIGPVDEIYRAPKHPYTRALLASRPSMDPRRRMEKPPLSGDPPNPISPPSGCRFRTRCPISEMVCEQKMPLLRSARGADAHPVACHAHQPGSGHSAAPSEGAVH